MDAHQSRFLCLMMVLGSNHYSYSKISGFISRGLRTSCQQYTRINKPIFKHAVDFADNIAIKDSEGSYNYASILMSSNKLATSISNYLDQKKEERVAFLCPNNVMYVIAQWACWISGNIAVPLGNHQPLDLLQYYISDCDANLLLATEEKAPIMRQLAERTKRKLLLIDKSYSVEAMMRSTETTVENCSDSLRSIGQSNDFYNNSNAMILYTSGSTGQPKGVVLSHRNLIAQVTSLVNAWQWNSKDVILHSLPLSHIHGVVNALLCPLAVGATCIMLPVFNPHNVWKHFLGYSGNDAKQVNIFMGVPTMYVQLLNEYSESYEKTERMIEYVRAVCSDKIRLMVSGSAPLSQVVFDRWKHVTGHDILERYGMTEIGMALSNPLHGQRKAGFVGNPLPGVKVRLVNDESKDKYNISVEGDCNSSRIYLKNNTTGHLQVQSNAVFVKYWGKLEETLKEFDGAWFKTGDLAEFIDGSYRILGRSSVDIIKCGGYKVSALQIESVIIEHPAVEDVTVVGVSDITWGQKIAAVVKLKPGQTLELRTIQHWVKRKLPLYMLPSVVKIVDKIPRNSLGKVNKNDIVKQLLSVTTV